MQISHTSPSYSIQSYPAQLKIIFVHFLICTIQAWVLFTCENNLQSIHVCVCVGVLAQRQQKLPQTCMKCSSLIASNSNCKYFTILKCIHKFNIVFSFIENSSRNIWNAAAAAKIDFQYACIVQLSSQVLLNCLFIISAKFCIICGNIFVLLAILIFCGITVICTI